MARSITTLVPWFGSNRTLAENVGRALDGCSWVGVPFAGGMCELAYIRARTMLVGDLHKCVINLARVVADPMKRAELIRRLEWKAFHPEELAHAQKVCLQVGPLVCDDETSLVLAENYFVAAWMGRNGEAGADSEFKSGLSVRWNAGGGDSVVRFRNAVDGLREWGEVFKRCTFIVLDVFKFLAKCKDLAGHGIYLDPPFPDAGDDYSHKFTEKQHCDLAATLAVFRNARIVCRFYDHPLIRELYPESRWEWNHFKGRKQSNAVGPEVLLTNRATASEE